MPGTVGGLIVALLALVPGYVATAAWSRVRVWREPAGDLRTVLQSLAFSMVIQVLASPLTVLLIYPVRDELLDHPRRIAVWSVITLLFAPVVVGWASARFTNLVFPPHRPFEEPTGWRAAIRAVVPVSSPPTVWDWALRNGVFDGHFVVVQFKDGRRLAGAFGKGSTGMTTPERHGVYLRQEWLLDDDGELEQPAPCSEGVLLPDLDQVLWIRIQSQPAGATG